MENKYKSNIKCEACVAKVKNSLSANPKIEKWEVDLQCPERQLSFKGTATMEEINKDLEALGYKLEPLNE